ncbi:MAG: hypothetical protein Q8R55_05540 [Candidatus Taylorbacteria bacterium]|nr:hypothetical protein [Candidatus Taylorbacteria bacterium]
MQRLTKQKLESRLLLAELEGEYFEDLTLAKFDKSNISAIVLEDGTKVYDNLPYIGIVKKYTIEVTTPPKDNGSIALCDIENKVIKLFRGRYEKSEKITLLHEMIHAYDHELMKYPTWRDYVLIYLYNKISRKLGRKRMRSILTLESHPEFLVNQNHNLLFVLKSLDLDLILRRKLGSVFAYGREKYFKN